MNAFANGTAADIGEMLCKDMKIGHSIKSIEHVKSKILVDADEGTKTLAEYQFENDVKIENTIYDDNSNVIDTIYSPIAIKYKNAFNYVYISRYSALDRRLSPDERRDNKYKDISILKSVFVGNAFSVWPGQIKCDQSAVYELKTSNQLIASTQFLKYNLHQLKHKNRMDLFFLPPDYLVTLDISKNWCLNKFCDPNKGMKVKKIQQFYQIIIDEKMNLRHNFKNLDYELFNKNRKIENKVPIKNN